MSMRIRNLVGKALGALGARRHWTWRGDTPPAITLIGHPFHATGRGQHIRAVWSALRSIGVRAFIYDIYRSRLPDPAFREFDADVIESIPDGLRLFHINGNEVEPTLKAIKARDPSSLTRGYNIVYPAWELPHFPGQWARQLERFDEVWAASAFVFGAVRRATAMPVLRIANACEPHLKQVFDRGYFGLPDDAFLVLFLYDLQSYTSRKNPAAVVTTFRRAVAARPAAKLHLVLKLNHLEHDPEEMQRIKSLVADIGDRVTILRGLLVARRGTQPDQVLRLPAVASSIRRIWPRAGGSHVLRQAGDRDRMVGKHGIHECRTSPSRSTSN